MRVPLVVCAKNEAAALGACLDSLLAARAWAEARLDVRFEPRVILDDTTDGSEAVARARGVAVERSSGGKVEAQRRGASAPAPFVIFADADIAVDHDTIHALARLMLDDPSVAIAHPPKRPVPPRDRGALAAAIHLYNLHRGFSSQRTWFSGKLFAIRRWSMPTRVELAPRLDALEPFYREGALRVDDIYLSRAAVAAHGPAAIRETAGGCVHFRAPESFSGMYRYYRRMRQELERLDLLFPEWRALHRRYGVRRVDARAVARLSAGERRLYALFRAALAACRVAYVCDRAYHRRRARAGEDWRPIEETKRPIGAGIARPGVIPLELWDLELDGATLFEARDHADFAERLGEAALQLARGRARRRGGQPLDARCCEIAALVIGGGGAARPGLREAMARAGLPAVIDPAGAFSGEAGGLTLLGARGGLVIDAGQVALKLSWTPRGRLRIARDFSSLPPNAPASEEHRARLREFLGGAIARAAVEAGRAPERMVLALPVELDDALTPGACSYPSMEGDRALVGDVMARAGLAGVPVDVLNDAELAALSARASGLAPADAVTLVLTLGWGVGGALVVPDA